MDRPTAPAHPGGPTPWGAGPQAGSPARGPAVDTWLWQSIVVTLFCCLPLGIVAIVNAAQASTALGAGDHATAVYKADLAKKLSLAGVAIGLVFVAGWLLLVVVGAAAGG